jgi:deazaflavin-dependent oxidoreductase (nitroreductase family)
MSAADSEAHGDGDDHCDDHNRGFNSKDIFARFWTSIHEATFRITNGQILDRSFGMPVLMLTTTGRNSGLPRTTMLNVPIFDGERLVVVGSNGGDQRPPAWLLNAAADPEVDVLYAGTTRRMRARMTAGEEREDLWARVQQVSHAYAMYQGHTQREIPVVVLEPSSLA